MMRYGMQMFLVTVLLLGLSISGVAAQEATPAADADTGLLTDLGYPELALTTDGETLDVPSEIEAGRYHLSLTGSGENMADLELLQLPEGVTPDELLAAFENPEPPEWFFEMVSAGGVSTAPGASAEAIVDLTSGEWVFNLFTYDETYTTTSNLPTTVTVTGEMSTTEDPQAAVEVGMIDFDFTMPDTVPAGANVWKIVNDGDEPHHISIGQIPEGTTEDAVIEASASFFGPPASPEVVASPGPAGLSADDMTEVYWTSILSTGQAMWVEVDLEPGTYAALCFIPTPDGTPHVMLGMVEVFTVE